MLKCLLKPDPTRALKVQQTAPCKTQEETSTSKRSENPKSDQPNQNRTEQERSDRWWNYPETEQNHQRTEQPNAPEGPRARPNTAKPKPNNNTQSEGDALINPYLIESLLKKRHRADLLLKGRSDISPTAIQRNVGRRPTKLMNSDHNSVR